MKLFNIPSSYIFATFQWIGFGLLITLLFLYNWVEPVTTPETYFRSGFFTLFSFILISWPDHKEFVLSSIRSREWHVPPISWAIIVLLWPVVLAVCIFL